jgi:hypothetical protein
MYNVHSLKKITKSCFASQMPFLLHDASAMHRNNKTWEDKDARASF